MSRKKKMILAAVAVLLITVLVAGLFIAFRPKEVEQTGNEIIRNATTEIVETEGQSTGFEIKEGAVHYSHGCILEAFRYPGWEVVQIDKNEKEEKMRQENDKFFVTTDKEEKAFFASDSSANTSETHDMAYVFTAPRKVKVDIVLNAKVSSSGGDGVVAYAYRNDTNNCIINGTIVTSAAALEAKDVILEKGDRIYFRYNRNKTTDYDKGNFYAKITFTELNPKGKAYEGEKFKIAQPTVAMPTAGTNSFSHGSIKYPDAYPFWSAVAISKTTGKETVLVKEEDKLYIAGDTTKKAFFGSDTSAHPSEKYDMAYVYTMPCKAKINIALTAQVAAEGGDGIVGYVYVNKKSNMIIDETVFTAADGAKAVPANNLVLEKGDKIYFVYNMNKSIKGDAGNFYGKVTYVEMNPTKDGGESQENEEQGTAAIPTAGTNSFSHGSIKYADTYPYWSAVSISRSTGKETAMVNGGDKLYISGDSKKKAYFASDATANPSDKYDMAYVYTMPCKAKINIALTAKVDEQGGDGVVGWVYVNKASNKLIDKTVITNADGAKALQLNNLVLEKGDKIYFVYNMNKSIKGDAGSFYGKVTYVEINPKGNGGSDKEESENQTVVEPGTISYSHGSLSDGNAYPCWNTQSVELSSKKISDMISGSVAKTMYVAKDATAYVNSEGKAQSSQKHDLMYVYTMPTKAKVSIALNASVGNSSSDGVVVYAYRNNTDNCIINHTEVTNTANKVVGQKDEVILNKGDKIYFRLNAKEATVGDAGWFYAKITYAEINPTGDTFVGEPYKAPSDEEESTVVEVSEGTITYGNNSISYPSVYPNWSIISISGATETPMVKNEEMMYVEGGTPENAYLASNGLAKVDGNSDLAYVYTMPNKAKVDIELMSMLTEISTDGVVASVYADTQDNAIIGNTKITNKDGLQILSADNIILNKGTKLYFRLNKNESSKGDEGLFQTKITFVELNPTGEVYKKITWKDMVAGGSMSGGAYGTYYSHGSINTPTLYPYFSTISISHADGSEKALVTGEAPNTMYVATDSSAYLNASGQGKSSGENDLVYVYTMPCKAKINITMNASVSSNNSDGVVVYAYANDTSNCIINRTVVTNTSNSIVGEAKAVTLDEGDKIYFRMNKKETTTDDAGYFYAKITFVNEEPDEEVFKGEDLEVEQILTWEDLVAGTGTNNGVSYSHGSISSPSTYAHWETKSINLANGEEKALVTGEKANHMYVDGDATAYLNSSGKAQVADGHDLAYVYTMPCKATIDIALNGSVTNTTSDGVVAYVYANSTANCIINRTLIKNTSNATVGAATGITLNKGDKIYFRLNKNATITGDAGYFYAKITYKNQAPAQNVYVGNAYETVTWAELASGVGTNKGKSYSHGSISSPGTYAHWETKSIDLVTGEEKALVPGSAANHMYVNGDGTAYLNSSGKMQSAANHDLLYVYTMPCKAKVNIALNGSVTSGSDGVKVSCYVNDMSNSLIAEKTITNTSNASVGSVNGVTLNTGDKIYFRVNRNTTTIGDNGMFYAAITFMNEAP